MLSSKMNWRDAGIMYEADAGGSSEGEANSSAAGEMSAEQIKLELERTRAALKIANKEAGDRRKRLDEIEANEAKRKEQELTESQRAAKRAEDAETNLKNYQDRYRTNAIRNAVRLAARDAGFVDAEDAIKLADLSTVELDETNDRVTGADEAIKALAKAKPHLLKIEKVTAPNINSGQGGAPVATTSAQALEAKKRSNDYVPY